LRKYGQLRVNAGVRSTCTPNIFYLANANHLYEWDGRQWHIVGKGGTFGFYTGQIKAYANTSCKPGGRWYWQSTAHLAHAGYTFRVRYVRLPQAFFIQCKDRNGNPY